MIKVKEPGGVFKRLVAFLIDSAILFVSNMIVLYLFFMYKFHISGGSANFVKGIPIDPRTGTLTKPLSDSEGRTL